MKVNADPQNRCPTWDLTPEEIEKFYRGAGAATVVPDDENNILRCFYHKLGDLPPDDETPFSYTKKIYPMARRQMDGMMSCHQFCQT